ncbi:MAG: AAA family ATPase [Bacteroidetes bacterium]|nr:AAA family ATPase [Bacteroidota bacterium]
MKLVAVYFFKHFLLNDATLNLGGKHFYHFSLNDGVLTASRTVNTKFIDNFFTEKSPNLSLVSAIAGSNGSGKTTILKDIGFALNKDYLANIIFFFEKEDETCYYYTNLTRLKIYCKGFTPIEFNHKIETIYYAPFFEASNINSTSGIDISTNWLIYHDSNQNKTKEKSDPILEHSYQNIYRQFNFLGTSFASILYEQFDLPTIDKARLSFRGPDYFPHKDDSKNDNAITRFHDTSTKFQPIIEKLLEIWRRELAPLRNEKKPESIKLWFLRKLMSSIFTPLEATNHFFEEGRVTIEPDDLNELTLKAALEFFLDSHSFIESQYNRLTDASLPTQKIKDLINIAFEIIESPTTSFKRDEKIEVSFEDARKLLEAEKAFLNEMSIFQLAPVGFIDAEPNIELSTGQKALMDLFSRFYFGIELIEKEKDNYEGSFPNHFILMLDEGDMTFHPKWLKRYIKAIIEVLPKLFAERFKSSTLQIIVTTHNPFILSDLPKENVIFLNKDEFGECKVIDGLNDMKQTFGANIHTLLSDSFFMDGLMGDFAKEKIDKVIRYLNKELKEGELMTDDEAEKIINIIGEPILKRHLEQQFQYNRQNKEIEELKQRIASLEQAIKP